MLIVFIYGRDNKTLIIYDWNEIEFRWILFDGNEDHAYTNIVNLFTRYKRVFHMTKTKLVTGKKSLNHENEFMDNGHMTDGTRVT